MPGPAESLERVFAPRSVAIVGASGKRGTVGHTLFRNLLAAEFHGVVYPVNPHWNSIGGVRAYPNVESLPEVPDLTVIMVPADGVPPLLERLGALGVRAAIIISAGFKEIGGEGTAREAEVIRIARKHGISIVGPNCFGVINTDPEVRLNATFSETLPTRGNIAFISQSGALGQGILLHAKREGIGFTKFVSVGNRAGINECDLLSNLGDDPSTKVILLYLESLAEGRRFLDVACEVAEKKPVLIIKSGRTALGEEAIKSHTGNLANSLSDSLYDAVFDEVGVLRAGSIGDLFRMAKVFASCKVARGPRLAILTNSGGPAILAADVAARGGLAIPRLSEEKRKAIMAAASVNSSARNPVDLTADATPAAYRNALQEILRGDEVDSTLVIATPTGNTSGGEVARLIVETRDPTRPLVSCLFGVADLSEEVALLEANGIPNFTFPEEGAQALCDLARYSSLQSRRRTTPPRFTVEAAAVREKITRWKASGTKALPDHVSRELLESYGIHFPRYVLAKDETELEAAAEKVRYPVVLKVASQDLLHKTEVGGVTLNLNNLEELKRAHVEMRHRVAGRAPTARIAGFVVEQMVKGGFETIVGIKRDPDFGPLLLFGMGGVFTETLQDIGFRPAPLSVESAWRLIDSVHAAAILRGTRGQTPGDLTSLHETLLRVSQMAVEQEMIQELDLNPLLVLPQGEGVVAADCRIIVG